MASSTTSSTCSSVDWQQTDISASLTYSKRPSKSNTHPDHRSSKGQEASYDPPDANEKHELCVHDIRGEEARYSLDVNGFQYVRHEVQNLRNQKEEDWITETVIPATEELVREITGAYKTIVFAHRKRCKAEDPRQLAASQAPAHAVHTDFTPLGARKHLETVVGDAAEAERLSQEHVLIINVWRPLKPIRKDPLAVCDWQSVDATNEIIANRLTTPQGWHELGKVLFGEKHGWVFLGGQTPDEPLVFKQYDSEMQGGCTLPHTAFEDRRYIDQEPRESLEIKMFAFMHNTRL